jgi:hypothetical protein
VTAGPSISRARAGGTPIRRERSPA